MDNAGKAVAGCVGVVVLVVALVVLGVIIDGFTLMVVWNWFAVPVLGLPVLTILEAYGLMIVWSVFTLDIAKRKSDSENAIVALVVRFFASQAVVLLIGYIVQSILFSG